MLARVRTISQRRRANGTGQTPLPALEGRSALSQIVSPPVPKGAPQPQGVPRLSLLRSRTQTTKLSDPRSLPPAPIIHHRPRSTTKPTRKSSKGTSPSPTPLPKRDSCGRCNRAIPEGPRPWHQQCVERCGTCDESLTSPFVLDIRYIAHHPKCIPSSPRLFPSGVPTPSIHAYRLAFCLSRRQFGSSQGIPADLVTLICSWISPPHTPQAIVNAAAREWEKVEGQCWHVLKCTAKRTDHCLPNEEDQHCVKCGKLVYVYIGCSGWCGDSCEGGHSNYMDGPWVRKEKEVKSEAESLWWDMSRKRRDNREQLKWMVRQQLWEEGKDGTTKEVEAVMKEIEPVTESEPRAQDPPHLIRYHWK